jgi:hypothetical protein
MMRQSRRTRQERRQIEVEGEDPEVAVDAVDLGDEEGDEVVAEASEVNTETCDVIALYSNVRKSESVL